MNDAVADALAIAHEGPIAHDGFGRTDDTDLSVKGESFVVPADVVSALGQGNTAAGMKVLQQILPPDPNYRAEGGVVPIVAAGGEYVVPPEAVARVGEGDIKKGHKVLREFVKYARAQHIKSLKKLPGPHR